MAKEMAEMCRKLRTNWMEGWKTFSKDVPTKWIEGCKTFAKDTPRQQVVIGLIAVSIATVAYADGVFGRSAVKTHVHRLKMENAQTMAIGVAKEIRAEAKEILVEAKEIRAEAKQTTEYCRNIKDDMIKLQQERINRSNRGWFGSWSKNDDPSHLNAPCHCTG